MAMLILPSPRNLPASTLFFIVSRNFSVHSSNSSLTFRLRSANAGFRQKINLSPG